MLTVQTITDAAVLETLIPEWDALDRSLSPRLPFTSPLWCVLWWKHFCRDGLVAKDQLRVYALRDPRGELVAVAPMFLTNRPGRGPLRVQELQFFGADPYVTEFRGPVCRPENSVVVAEALAAHIAEQNECDWVQWRGLRVRDEDARSRIPFHVNDRLGLVDHYLEVPDTWDAFRQALPRNIKESLRKCYNSLKREKIDFELRVVRSPTDAPTAVDRFLELHQTRAEKTDTVKHGDVFESTPARALLRDYCMALAERDELRIFQLVIDGNVVATRIGFALGDEIYLYFSGYDVAWGRFSVMTTTVAEAIKWSIDQGMRLVNLSTGTDVSKMRWRPQQIEYVGGYDVFPGVKSRLSFRFIQKLRDRDMRPAPALTVADGASSA